MLAAGGSSRLGRPKQLLPFRGTTLIRHAVRTALDTALGPVVVVLGAEADACRAAIADLEADVIVVPNWERGMGVSLVCGFGAALGHNPDRVLFTSCDQPFVTAKHLKALDRAAQTTQRPMAAASYNGILGVPALFDQTMFEALAGLGYEHGAGQLLRARPKRVAKVECPEAARDIDTSADLRLLQ